MYNVNAVLVMIRPIDGPKVDSSQENRYTDSLGRLEALVPYPYIRTYTHTLTLPPGISLRGPLAFPTLRLHRLGEQLKPLIMWHWVAEAGVISELVAFSPVRRDIWTLRVEMAPVY